MNKLIAVALINSVTALNREPLLTWAPTEPASHPVNYFVPNFGLDHDIVATQAHEAGAAKALKTTWTPTKDKDDNWVVPTESASFQLLQTGAEMKREPLLTWAPTEPASHPVNYFVPNFGVDSEIKASQAHEAAAAKALKTTWTPVKDEKTDKWIVPTEDAFFKL